jgi:hypothetical protein
MIRPEPEFLRSFAALERSIRALPARVSPLPAPEPPDAEVLEAWLEPYRSWNLPQVYLDYVARYGGVSDRESPLKVTQRSLTQLLASRTRRDANGLCRTRHVLLCPDPIDGDVCLIDSDDGAEPRVGLMIDDDDISYKADSFALYLWSQCFYFAAVQEARFRESVSFVGVPTHEFGRFVGMLAAELMHRGFEFLGADSCTICGQRGGTLLWVGNRSPRIFVAVANRGSIRAVTEAWAEVTGLLEHCRALLGIAR